MYANYAKPRKYDRSPPRNVVFLVYPDIALLDLAGPLQVLNWARKPGAEEYGYKSSLVSHLGGSIPTDTLVSVDTEPAANWVDQQIDTLMVIGGDGVYEAAKNADFVELTSRLIAASRRVCSVCSGAYLLAATGLLNNRRAVTHWEDMEILKSEFPDIKVEVDPIYVKDGNVWTSAGVTAGTDMSLAIAAEDLGHEAALERAQALVTYMVRPGGQSQFSTVLERQKQDREHRFTALHGWIRNNLDQDLRVEQLAEYENMSTRNFHRLYMSVMGTTPARTVENMRLELARDLLETTQTPIKVIAGKCGFTGEEQLRRSFLRTLGVLPKEYRQRFQLA
jgi:transcriptional regulator GlxA family with amidase domain